MDMIKILSLLIFSHIVSYFLMSRISQYRANLRKWLLVTTIVLGSTLLFRNIVIGYFITFIILYFITHSQKAEESVALFFSQAFVLTTSVGIELNPGIDLGQLTYPRVLILSIFLPLLWLKAPRQEFLSLNTVDKIVLLYVLWILILSFRIPSLTGIIRQNFWFLVDVVLPYVVVKRYLDNYSLLFAGLSYALLSQLIVGIIEAYLKWHLYTDFELIARYAEPLIPQYKYRGEYLRVQAVFMNPLLYTVFANLGFVCFSIYSMKLRRMAERNGSIGYCYIALAISAMGILASVSRSGLLGLISTLLILFVVVRSSGKGRKPLKSLVLSLTTIAAVVLPIVYVDLKESFSYRIRLIETSTNVILSNPIFGRIDAVEDARMQTLVLGEGIVDIVNSYVNIALHYGIPGLVMYIGAFWISLSRLSSRLSSPFTADRYFGYFCMVSTVILALYLFTGSSFSWVSTWTWLTFAMTSNYLNRADLAR